MLFLSAGTLSSNGSRLNRLTVHPGSPELLNLAMADVKSLKTLSKGNTFLSKSSSKAPTLFFTTGIALFSRLRETFASEKLSHQVGIAVSDLTWHRLLAVIAATFKINAPLNIPSYKRGVVFSTRMKNGKSPMYMSRFLALMDIFRKDTVRGRGGSFSQQRGGVPFSEDSMGASVTMERSW